MQQIEDIVILPAKKKTSTNQSLTSGLQVPAYLTEGKGWDSSGHLDAGNEAFKQFFDKLDADLKNKLINYNFIEIIDNEIKICLPKLDENGKPHIYDSSLKLCAGNIVALAGDFYSVPESPICFGQPGNDQEERFQAAYKKLAHEAKIDDIEWLTDLFHCDQQKSLDLEQKKARILQRFFSIFGPIKEAIENIQFTLMFVESGSPCAFWQSLYFNLLMTNFDHFKDGARIAYQTGHYLALKAARQGNVEKDPLLFLLAICYELYACHYLTDLFAAGHIRTPRRELLNYLCGASDLNSVPDLKNISFHKKFFASQLALSMHNEDGKHGLVVHSDHHKEKWEAYGDRHYFKEINQPDVLLMIETVVKGLNDIALAYQNMNFNIEHNKDYFLKYIPKIHNESTPPLPLFRINPHNPKQVQIREGDAETRCALVSIEDHEYFLLNLHSQFRLHYSEIFPGTYSTAYLIVGQILYYVIIEDETIEKLDIHRDHLQELQSNYKNSNNSDDSAKKVVKILKESLSRDELDAITKMTSHSCVTYTPLAVSTMQRFFNIKIKIPGSTELQLKDLSKEEEEKLIRSELPHLK